MGLAEAVLALADEIDKDTEILFPDNSNPALNNTLVGYATALRLMVKAAQAPAARPIDTVPTVSTDRGSMFVGMPPGVAFEKKLKEIERQIKEVAAKRELRDKEDLGLACIRSEVSNRMARFVGGPLDGDFNYLTPDVVVGDHTHYSDQSGRHVYQLREDMNYHLVDPKP